jgi:FkbM family methyltransferase
MQEFLFKCRKPEFYLHPTNVFRRVKGANATGVQSTHTIWGQPMEIDARDAIGKAILRTGLYDLALSEMLWVLADGAQLCLDIGANIGYTSLLMLNRISAAGSVLLFEPNPFLQPRLAANLTPYLSNQNATLHPFALSDQDGSAFLHLPDQSAHNDGIGFVSHENKTGNIPIALKRLDTILPESCSIDLIKIDVEGHEEAVLRGAEKLLQKNQVQHLVFEEHHPYPSAVTLYLESFGYQIKRIKKSWCNIQLEDPNKPLGVDSEFEATNYLATIDLQIVRKKCEQHFFYQIL